MNELAGARTLTTPRPPALFPAGNAGNPTRFGRRMAGASGPGDGQPVLAGIDAGAPLRDASRRADVRTPPLAAAAPLREIPALGVPGPVAADPEPAQEQAEEHDPAAQHQPYRRHSEDHLGTHHSQFSDSVPLALRSASARLASPTSRNAWKATDRSSIAA